MQKTVDMALSFGILGHAISLKYRMCLKIHSVSIGLELIIFKCVIGACPFVAVHPHLGILPLLVGCGTTCRLS